MEKSKAIENLDKQGVHIFGEILDAGKINELYEEMIKARVFSGDIFLSQVDYEKQTDNLNANPS